MPKTARIPRLTAVLAAAAAGALALSGTMPSNAAQSPEPASAPGLADAFRTAASQYDVPRELLVGIGYAESHLDDHDGQPSQANGYGLMHLVSNPSNPTMSEAAKLTGLGVEKLAKDPGSNILGAAPSSTRTPTRPASPPRPARIRASGTRSSRSTRTPRTARPHGSTRTRCTRSSAPESGPKASPPSR